MGYYDSHPSAAIMMTVIIFLIGYRRGTSDGAPFCSTVPVDDPRKFSINVDQVLSDLVANTVSKPSLTGKTIGHVVTYPAQYSLGAATGQSFCYFGVNDSACTDCLAELVPYLQNCKTFTWGGAYYDGWCTLQFQALQP